MNDTIELYRKILELDPTSKAFYPLAGLLHEQGASQEAVILLRRGLAGHPEHFEARLLLVEALRQCGQTDEATAEVAELGQVLTRFPGFWTLWSESVAGGSPDAGLALAYMARWIEGRQPSWAQVLQMALGQMLADADQPCPPPCMPAADAADARVDAVEVPEVPEAAELPEAGMAAAAAPEVQPVDIVDDAAPEELVAEAVEPEATTEQLPAKGPADPLRTRTMAEVLADQGDYAAAVEIYAELLAQADEQRQPVLQARLDELRQAMGAEVPVTEALPDHAEADMDAAEPRQSESASSRVRFIGRLEKLAARLERRASA